MSDGYKWYDMARYDGSRHASVTLEGVIKVIQSLECLYKSFQTETMFAEKMLYMKLGIIMMIVNPRRLVPLHVCDYGACM